MVIELRDVSVVFEKGTDLERKVFERLNLSFQTSSCILLVGETGAGKTTLINLLDLLIKPSTGTMLYDGIDPFTNPYEFRRKFGVAFQIPERQFFNETVYDEITYACKNFRVPYDKEKILKVLELVGLSESVLKKSPFKLSGGEQRKVAIASILLHDPEFLMFDEPTAGLDLKGVLSILSILESFRKSGKGYLVATHEPEIFSGLFDKRIEIKSAGIVEVESL
ncbi:energy-coupling factor ABC transporter ATP-binding protein [Fervidobacterium thailandense]|uniref:ABC transporter n=1 Tax=Fervidobacterium thailandense TaxID=1008305 RepID=A0A1E3G2K0_9BACT|nr:ABC transporter ATP-binding protein [Fervidobacterium thailandense]ODN30083.1 ABC transporter [Fervidobacterium thailandense]